MGYSIEQYGMDDAYSNGSGLFGGKIKSALGIGDGKVLGIVINKDKNTQSGDEESSQDNKEIDNKNIASLSSTPKKSNTGLYIGIGVGVLAIGIITTILIVKNK